MTFPLKILLSSPFVVLLGILVGCHHPGNKRPHTKSVAEMQTATAVKMVHQIVFDNLGQTHVFDGFMIQHDQSYVIKAFAGPGVDLFTLKRNDTEHSETLHLTGLADKINMEYVGADIARVYLRGCSPPLEGSAENTCQFSYEPLREHYNPNGTLKQRIFPRAYGVGLTIDYMEYQAHDHTLRPTLIKIAWGDGSRSMTIKTVAFETLNTFDPVIFVD